MAYELYSCVVNDFQDDTMIVAISDDTFMFWLEGYLGGLVEVVSITEHLMEDAVRTFKEKPGPFIGCNFSEVACYRSRSRIRNYLAELQQAMASYHKEMTDSGARTLFI